MMHHDDEQIHAKAKIADLHHAHHGFIGSDTWHHADQTWHNQRLWWQSISLSVTHAQKAAHHRTKESGNRKMCAILHHQKLGAKSQCRDRHAVNDVTPWQSKHQAPADGDDAR